MTEPATPAAAALAGTAAAIPMAGSVALALGIPVELLAWSAFGGLVALANTEPHQPPREGWRLAGHVALRLAIAAGVGGAFAHLAADLAVALAAKAGVPLSAGTVLVRAAAILLGFGTAFIPEAMRAIRARLGAAGGPAT